MCCKFLLQYCCVLCVLFFIGCTEPEQPITKEEAVKFAVTLTHSLRGDNGDRFTGLLDLECFEKRIMSESGDKLQRSMVKGAVDKIKSGALGKQIILALGEKGTYRLVKQYEKDHRQHLIFRLYNEEINYHDIELIKKHGTVKVADIFVYATGENLSGTMAQALLSFTEDMATGSPVEQEDLNKIVRIKKYLLEGKHQQANQLFISLPQELREQRLFKIINIQIASGLDNEQYLAAMNSFQHDYPDAPNIYLIMLDSYFLNEDAPGILRCVNRLDSLINKDPFLDYYRAIAYRLDDNIDNQITCLERLHKNMPEFGNGTRLLVNAYLQDNKIEKAVTLNRIYQQRNDVDTAFIEKLYTLFPDFEKKMKQ
jgi:tetratricopeptide (TPR) repeat protein